MAKTCHKKKTFCHAKEFVRQASVYLQQRAKARDAANKAIEARKLFRIGGSVIGMQCVWYE